MWCASAWGGFSQPVRFFAYGGGKGEGGVDLVDWGGIGGIGSDRWRGAQGGCAFGRWIWLRRGGGCLGLSAILVGVEVMYLAGFLGRVAGWCLGFCG